MEVKAGPPRSELERRGLALAGIPVEHGEYTRSLRRHGLERGEACRLTLPGELFAGHESLEQVFLQLRYHNVYGELAIESLVWTSMDGEERTISLDAAQLASLHREGSGGDHHVEMRFALPGPTASLDVVYSCPRHELTPKALAIVAGARRNLAVRERR